ncbi:hypothetical protein DSC47_14765 [Elizabethkingia miricola]|uniref:hypothetical protein n=1 Tax=Elizabethkingia bruuniana TaxID=1756149 RepID=UPI00099961C0|nr:hypothetical protein [Elizabethkingia bruuniana]OPC56656.1 hypothetical protein BAY07_06545 [Elizabethkingia bruuniana]OPC59422.1 hypothetical protein BAY13_10880 [Elizabethkingia bruuniana]RBI90674.1 hypothetical protein DSC47_14765 [Elizabethkingia miricola]
MSAIRLYIWKTTLLTVLLLIFFSCKEKKTSKDTAISSEKIESINITTEGGGLGYFRNIRVNKDSISSIQRQFGTDSLNKSRKRAITPTEWNRLISEINLSSVSKIKNGPSYQPFDGTDDIWEIKTSTHTYRIINGKQDIDNYKSLEAVYSQLEELIQKK